MAIFQFANCWFTMLVQVWAVLPCFTALLDISLESQERPWASLSSTVVCNRDFAQSCLEIRRKGGTTTTSGKRVDTSN